MNYPKYPTPRPDNVKPEGFKAKPDVATLKRIAAELGQAGIEANPKGLGIKRPHWEFWQKAGGHVRLKPTPENLDKWLPSPNVDGLAAVCNESCNGRMIVVDIDPKGDHEYAERVYNEVQELSPTRFVIHTAGNGVHLYYQYPEGVPELKRGNDVHWKNLDLQASVAIVVLPGSYNHYFGDSAKRKGVADGHLGYYTRIANDPETDYTQVPVMSQALYDLFATTQAKEEQQKRKKLPTTPKAIGAHNYERTAEAIAKIDLHLSKETNEKIAMTLECLKWVLEGWKDKTYEEWTQVWMAAYHAADGDATVRDYIASHPDVWVGRSYSESERFCSTWDQHSPNPDGYTIASLMYLAREAGWLADTGLEINRKDLVEIDVKYIQEWTAAQTELPKRVLVISQTGSGKTFNISYLYERLGKPKSVIFVPTTKLAIELANTLRVEHKMPITLYIDQESGQTKDAVTLAKAQILVTTLQTFGNKVHKVSPMSKYGLVYFEESDQLFQQFARGGGSVYGSHVRDKEARAGYAVIRDAFENSGNVWCVDATMTQVTQTVANATKGNHELTIIRNVRVAKKAPVHLLLDKDEAYQMVLSGLLENKRVVVACDTAQTAEEVVQTMETVGATTNKRVLLITAHTERNPNVHQFMSDVNSGAAQYDLVAYNSVMASGVSITSVKPDMIVQICSYLTPRVNLQLLNRYRQQEVVYCYYQTSDRMYNPTDMTLNMDAYLRAGIESQLVNIPTAERTPDAELRGKIASMSVADEGMQNRSASDFYNALLVRDGREVIYAENVPTYGIVETSVKEVRAAKKEFKDKIKATWPETRPVNRDNPADPHMSALEIAQGEMHAKIKSLLKGNIPDEDPEKVCEIVASFDSVVAPLNAFLNQAKTLSNAESFLADKGASITNISNYVTMVSVVSTTYILFNDVRAKLTNEELAIRAPLFLLALEGQSANYDAVVTRYAQKYQQVCEANPDPIDRALAFSKILLARIGLKQRYQRDTMVKDGKRGGGYVIENLDDALTFVGWRENRVVTDFDLTNTVIMDTAKKRSNHMIMYQAMNTEQKMAVMDMMNDERTTDFQTAVESVLKGVRF